MHNIILLNNQGEKMTIPIIIAQDNANALLGVILVIGFIVVGFFSYLLPSFIAGMRKHQNTAAIVILNILLGWTFIGWVIALVWSFTAVNKDNE